MNVAQTPEQKQAVTSLIQAASQLATDEYSQRVLTCYPDTPIRAKEDNVEASFFRHYHRIASGKLGPSERLIVWLQRVEEKSHKPSVAELNTIIASAISELSQQWLSQYNEERVENTLEADAGSIRLSSSR